MVHVHEKLGNGGSGQTYENTQEDATCAIAASTTAASHDGSTCNEYGSPADGEPRNNLQLCGLGRHDDHQYRTDHDQRGCRAASRYCVHWTGERNTEWGCTSG